MTEFTESVEETPVAIAPVSALNNDPALLDKLFARLTATDKNALADRPLFQTRTISFVVDGSICEPDVFVDSNGDYFDFTLTMRALGSAAEVEILDRATGHAVPLQLSKAMLFKLNGVPIKSAQRDWLWEALGMRGRSLCFAAYQQLAGPSQVALGKYQASFTVSTA